MTGTDQADGLLVRHLQKSYVGRQVVQDVSVHVNKGEVVGLLGPMALAKPLPFT